MSSNSTAKAPRAILDAVTQSVTPETPEEQARRYEATLTAIAACTLTGVDYGDWVQAVCEDALSGLWPECWNCSTFVHDGPCVGEEAEG